MTTCGLADPVIDLDVGADIWHTSYTLAPERSRPDRRLYGGTALAATLEAFQLATGRPPIWATVQFISQAVTGSRIDHVLEPLAASHRIDQLRLTASVDGTIVYTALGACASARADALVGTGLSMPRVNGPETAGTNWLDGRPRSPGSGPLEGSPFYRVTEYRNVPYAAASTKESEPPGRIALWARMRGRTASAASIGFLADVVPMAVCEAAGVEGGGTSIDNTLRLGRLVDTEWMLLDVQGHAAVDGTGYGAAHVWSPDGVLMATASQTAKLVRLDQ